MNNITKTYSDGLEDAWNAALRISMMTNEEKLRLFKVSPRDNVFECFTPSHILNVLEMKDAAREKRITKDMLETYMYTHGVCNVDLNECVMGSLMLDIVNDLISDLINLGTLDKVFEYGEC